MIFPFLYAKIYHFFIKPFLSNLQSNSSAILQGSSKSSEEFIISSATFVVHLSYFIVKQVTIFIVFAAFLLQTFSGEFIIADYYINRAVYEKLCINKDKPQMHCNGKCQMTKKMKEEDKKKQDNPDRNSTLKIDLFCQPINLVQLASFSTITRTYSTFSTPLIKNRSFSIFHPPQPLS